jgi:hypothetical protein
MRTKLLLTGAVAAAALALAGPPAPAGAGAAAHCAHTAGTAPLVTHRDVAVYRTAAVDFGARLYACWRPTGRTMLLHTNTTGADVVDVIFDRHVAVTGSVVAFHVSASGDHNYDYVRSFDVRTGALQHASRVVARPSGLLPPAAPTAIATNADGVIVWLADGKLRVTGTAGNRIAATTAAGPITHVAATAAKAHWTQGGTDHRARLS